MVRKNRVKELRLNAGINSQAALARIIGVSNSTISDIENRKKNINRNERIKLMELFGLSDAEELYQDEKGDALWVIVILFNSTY